MIFTSIGVALLAAVTGMTTIRTPGGDEQQVEVEPAYAWEMTVADIDNPKEFVRSLREYNSLNIGLTRPQARAIAGQMISTFETINQGLRENRFLPTQVTYYNCYSIEKIEGLRLLPDIYNQHIEYSIISFTDENDNEIHFLDTCGSSTFENYSPMGNVIVFDSNMDDVDLLGIKAVSAIFAKGGLADLTYAKVYNEVNYNLLDNVDHSLVDLMGSDINHATGIFLENGAWYNNWEVIGEILRRRRNRHDIVKPGLENVAMSADDIITTPIGGLMMHYELEQAEFLHGQHALNSNQVISGMNTAMTTDYGQLIRSNDLVVLN